MKNLKLRIEFYSWKLSRLVQLWKIGELYFVRCFLLHCEVLIFIFKYEIQQDIFNYLNAI